MAFNINALLGALNAGAELAKEAAGFMGPQAEVIAGAAQGIVKSATAVYQQVKPTLAADDVETVDAALKAAHDKTGLDLDRVLAALDAAAQR